ncbi:MAG TPA: hypothetical protein PK247_02565 [Candidatus Goldiibacteriota bacterium]|nr:hypothetical protein [Candidatus Goldiibacteriota bacterium]
MLNSESTLIQVKNGLDERGHRNSLITGPLISYDKNFLDNNRLLKIKQFGHNGTNYNAEITNYFEVDVNFNLVRIFSLETMCLYPGDRGGHVVRNIRQISQSKFEVITELVDSGNKEKKMIVAKGYLEKKARKFRLTKRIVYLNEFKESILNSNKEDDEFLKDGYGYFDYPCCDKDCGQEMR